MKSISYWINSSKTTGISGFFSHIHFLNNAYSQTNTSRAIKFLELVPIPIAQYRNKIVSIQFKQKQCRTETNF